MTDNTTIPQNFDWVTARAKCHAEAAFGILEETVKTDVSTRNQLSEARENEFGFKSDRSSFAVNRGRSRVVFRLNNDAVIVSSVCKLGAETELFRATTNLLDSGVCRLEIEKDTSLEYWQVSRLAVEALFFDK